MYQLRCVIEPCAGTKETETVLPGTNYRPSVGMFEADTLIHSTTPLHLLAQVGGAWPTIVSVEIVITKNISDVSIKNLQNLRGTISSTKVPA